MGADFLATTICQQLDGPRSAWRRWEALPHTATVVVERWTRNTVHPVALTCDGFPENTASQAKERMRPASQSGISGVPLASTFVESLAGLRPPARWRRQNQMPEMDDPATTTGRALCKQTAGTFGVSTRHEAVGQCWWFTEDQ